MSNANLILNLGELSHDLTFVGRICSNLCVGFYWNLDEPAGHTHVEQRTVDCLAGGRSGGTSRGSCVGVGVLASC